MVWCLVSVHAATVPICQQGDVFELQAVLRCHVEARIVRLLAQASSRMGNRFRRRLGGQLSLATDHLACTCRVTGIMKVVDKSEWPASLDNQIMILSQAL
jgi:hypothetical protein